MYFSDTLKVHASADIHEFLPLADVIVLAVKPQGARDVCLQLGEGLRDHSPLVISVLAGVTLGSLSEWMGGHLPIVRAAPNTPAMIQLGATGLFANEKTTPEGRRCVEKIITSTGIFAWVPREENMNAITALSGSGPAYYFYLIEIMREIAIREFGIDPSVANQFAIQTAYGAAKLALESGEDVTTLRARVTSKKGTTEAALKVMGDEGLSLIFEKALKACYARAQVLN